MSERILVTAAVAPLNVEPRASSPLVSQRLAGHLLDVLETRMPWLRVRGEDAYEGWIHRGYTGAAAADRYTLGRRSLGAMIEADGAPHQALPFGARVPDEARVVQGQVVTERERERRFERDPAAVAQTAVAFFAGTPYLWGGITPWGADCSGLVQSCFGMHGIPLPRDSSQQAEVGRPLHLAPNALDAGDLLFFSDRPDGTITHVAIAIGDGRLVHLALGRGGYAVERLGDGDEYSQSLIARFRFARRVE